nr:unnamed protein product [Callosobruchus analis]
MINKICDADIFELKTVSADLRFISFNKDIDGNAFKMFEVKMFVQN